MPRIARKGIESSEKLGRHRWVIKRTHAWFSLFRRLLIRYEAIATVAASLITLNAGCIRRRFQLVR